MLISSNSMINKYIFFVLILRMGVCSFSIEGANLHSYNFCLFENEKFENEKIISIAGMSAVGYLPLWRVGFNAEGIEVSLPQIFTGQLPYQTIEISAEEWRLSSDVNDVSLMLIIANKPGKCSLSKQWYPYSAELHIQRTGLSKFTFKGIAMGKDHKPLPPHPNGGSQLVGTTNIPASQLYRLMDNLKFYLMDEISQRVMEHFHFPLNITTSKGKKVIADQYALGELLEDEGLKKQMQAIISCKYTQIDEKDGVISIDNDLVVFRLINGILKICSINMKST